MKLWRLVSLRSLQAGSIKLRGTGDGIRGKV